MTLVDILIIVGSILASLILGMIFILFIGHKISFNYFKVKVSRGSKVLLFVKTSLGWISLVAKKEGQFLKWKYKKTNYVTNIEKESEIGKFGTQECVYTLLSKPTQALNLNEGEMYPSNFDMETFNNMLIRAVTKPNYEGTEDIKKKLIVVIVLLILLIIGVLLTYNKASAIFKVLVELKQMGIL